MGDERRRLFGRLSVTCSPVLPSPISRSAADMVRIKTDNDKRLRFQLRRLKTACETEGSLNRK
jgi:hypothetical protein